MGIKTTLSETRKPVNGRISKEKLGEIILEAYEQGAVSVEDFENYTGKSSHHIGTHPVYKTQIPKIQDRRREALQMGVAQGVKSLGQLARMMGLTKGGVVYQTAEELGISLPENLEPHRYRPEIDRHIDEGKTLEAIGKLIGKTGESVRLYINKSGQHKYWREQKRNKQLKGEIVVQTQTLIGTLGSVIDIRAQQIAEQEGWAEGLAIRYIEQRKKTNGIVNFTYDEVKNALRHYEQVQEKGEGISLRSMGNATGISTMGMREILMKLELPILGGTKKMQLNYRREKQKAVERGYSLPFSGDDIAYFLDLPVYIPSRRYWNNGKGRAREHPNGSRALSQRASTGHSLTYRLASQIYEARALEFTSNQTVTLLETQRELVGLAFEHQDKIRPAIVEGLRTLYNDPTIKKPYVTKGMRKKLEKKEGRKKLLD